MQHTLESGETIDLRPVKGPNGLKAKDKDAYEAAIKLYVEFDDKGMPDMSGIPFSMSLTKLQRNALLARLLLGWSLKDDDGNPLPLPAWNGEQDSIDNEASLGEIDIDSWNEIEEILEPYIAKVARKPDPKGTTTASSNGTSREKVARSRKG